MRGRQPRNVGGPPTGAGPSRRGVAVDDPSPRRLRPAVVPAGIAGRMRDGDQHGPPSTAKPRRTCTTPTRARGRRRAVGGPIGKDGRATPLASPSHCRRTAETARGRCSQRPADRGEGCPEALAGSMVGAAGEPGVAQAAEAAALRDRAQAEVATADAGYAGAWQAARDAGAAARHGLPPAGRYARRPANSAATADPSPATTASYPRVGD